MGVLIHYGDLALKGRNRGAFVKQLSDNIESATGGRCEAHRERIILRGGDPDKLKHVFGISWYAPYFSCSKNMDDIADTCLCEVGRQLEKSPGAGSFSVRAKRADKAFAVNSSDIERRIGEKIRLRFGLKVDIKSPDLPVHIRVDMDEARLHFGKTPGAGGLPVGSGGSLKSRRARAVSPSAPKGLTRRLP